MTSMKQELICMNVATDIFTHFVQVYVIFFDKITVWHTFCKKDYVKSLQSAPLIPLSLQPEIREHS